MKSSAIINTCRGGVIDEMALTKDLSSRKIAFAGLDVLEQEPPDPRNPLLKLDNLLLTPPRRWHQLPWFRPRRVSAAG